MLKSQVILMKLKFHFSNGTTQNFLAKKTIYFLRISSVLKTKEGCAENEIQLMYSNTIIHAFAFSSSVFEPELDILLL